MAAKDYYKILGVEKNASQDEIKKAYRNMAKKYHPDLHPDDTVAAEKFKECNEAYSVVGDPDKRKRYDRGEMDFQGGGAGSGFNPFGGGGFSATGFDDIFDIFSGFGFGGNRQKRQAVGSDIQYSLNLTFMESALGCTKSINFSRVEKCPTCKGSGAKDSSHVKTCDKCQGSGQMRYTQNTLFGQQVVVGECDKCHGSGKIVTENCKSCGGKGLVNKNKVIKVNIPAGVEHGSVLPIENEGNAVKDGANGRLLLVLQVAKSKVFNRERNNLYVNVPVTFATAVGGGEVEIPALDGVFVHKLKEGTKNGETIVFRNKGIKGFRGGTGDLYATMKIEVPKGISKQQKQLLNDFEAGMSMKNYPDKKQYLEEISKLYEKKK